MLNEPSLGFERPQWVDSGHSRTAALDPKLPLGKEAAV